MPRVLKMEDFKNLSEDDLFTIPGPSGDIYATLRNSSPNLGRNTY